MTNFEWAASSPDNLIDFIIDYADTLCCPVDEDEVGCRDSDCRKCLLKWIEEEYKE